jgi:hypothetical protein
MVILMSATRIDITARGSNGRYLYGGTTTADTNDYDFAISADGGSCVTNSFQVPVVLRKYQPTTATSGDISTAFATLYDSAPLGGYGGMGIVQLMAPPGTAAPGPASPDQTSTVLDDNIRFIKNGAVQLGTAKKDLLGWRGYPNQLGQGVDDLGQVIPRTAVVGANTVDLEGDIRPCPILLPVPFGTTSRLRSHWIDTGSSSRIPIDNGSIELSRAIVDPAPSTLAGPRYEFDGVDPSTGYALYDVNGSTAITRFVTVVDATALAVPATNTTYLGEPAYHVELASSVLGSVIDRYTQYEAEVLNASNQVIGSFRILSHTDSELTLSAESGAFPAAAAKLRVKAKFFDVITNGVAGFGGTYLGASSGRVPIANVRIGFAFHQNPANPAALRFPAAAGTYAYNLSDPLVQEQIRNLHAAFVQWDILFDTAFKSAPGDVPPVLSPDTPLPELHFLRLPFRF